VIFEESAEWKWSGSASENLMEFQVEDGGCIHQDGWETATLSDESVLPQQELGGAQPTDNSGIGNVPDELQDTELGIGGNANNSVQQNLESHAGGGQSQSDAAYDDLSDEEPQHFRSLNEIYQNTDEVELEDSEEIEALLTESDEPTSYNEAAESPKCVEAMNSEIRSIEKNKTWELARLPAGQKAIGLKWVFKLKRNADGEVVKHKARLVAKGYVQKQGVDYEEVFAPIARVDTVKLIIAMAANRGWKIHHLDVKIAFLNGKLEE
jgi:hypothetical protein